MQEYKSIKGEEDSKRMDKSLKKATKWNRLQTKKDISLSLN